MCEQRSGAGVGFGMSRPAFLDGIRMARVCKHLLVNFGLVSFELHVPAGGHKAKLDSITSDPQGPGAEVVNRTLRHTQPKHWRNVSDGV